MLAFYMYMQGAANAMHRRGEPFIDETLGMAIDAGFRFMLDYPNATLQEALAAGGHRIDRPTTYQNEYPANL